MSLQKYLPKNKFGFVRLKIELEPQNAVAWTKTKQRHFYHRFILLNGESLYAGDFFMMFFKIVRS